MYGSKAFDATLDLEYLLGDDELASLLESYHTSFGAYKTLTLDGQVFEGISPSHGTNSKLFILALGRHTDSRQFASGQIRVRVRLVATLDD